MTMHKAKGLDACVVFVPAAEEEMYVRDPAVQAKRSNFHERQHDEDSQEFDAEASLGPAGGGNELGVDLALR